MACSGAAVIPDPRAPGPGWECLLCGLEFPLRDGQQQPSLCDQCHRGPLGYAAAELARRLAGASQWWEREDTLATMTVRHRAVVAILEAAVQIPGVDGPRLQRALLRELTAPLEWRGPGYEVALFASAIGRGPDPDPGWQPDLAPQVVVLPVVEDPPPVAAAPVARRIVRLPC